MTRRKLTISILFILILSNTNLCIGQVKARWSNKDKGTFIISPHSSGNFDTTICGISIRLYELSEIGCHPIEGKIVINNKEYVTYDSSKYVDREGYHNLSDFLYIDMSPGIYTITAYANNKYYKVKTGKLKFEGTRFYEIEFYLIRKDALKRK